MDVSDSPDQPVFIGPAELLDRDDTFRSTRQRVAPQHHRHRPGMAGHAGPAGSEPRGARDRAHDSDWQIEAFEHRSLLDMEFDIGQQFAARPRSRADMVGIETELRKRIAHRNSGGILYTERALVE